MTKENDFFTHPQMEEERDRLRSMSHIGFMVLETMCFILNTPWSEDLVQALHEQAHRFAVVADPLIDDELVGFIGDSLVKLDELSRIPQDSEDFDQLRDAWWLHLEKFVAVLTFEERLKTYPYVLGIISHRIQDFSVVAMQRLMFTVLCTVIDSLCDTDDPLADHERFGELLKMLPPAIQRQVQDAYVPSHASI